LRWRGLDPIKLPYNPAGAFNRLKLQYASRLVAWHTTTQNSQFLLQRWSKLRPVLIAPTHWWMSR